MRDLCNSATYKDLTAENLEMKRVRKYDEFVNW